MCQTLLELRTSGAKISEPQVRMTMRWWRRWGEGSGAPSSEPCCARRAASVDKGFAFDSHLIRISNRSLTPYPLCGCPTGMSSRMVVYPRRYASRILPHERGLVDAAMALSLLQASEEGCARMTNLGFVVRIVTRNPSPPPRSPLISVRIVTMNPSPPPR